MHVSLNFTREGWLGQCSCALGSETLQDQGGSGELPYAASSSPSARCHFDIHHKKEVEFSIGKQWVFAPGRHNDNHKLGQEHFEYTFQGKLRSNSIGQPSE